MESRGLVMKKKVRKGTMMGKGKGIPTTTTTGMLKWKGTPMGKGKGMPTGKGPLVIWKVTRKRQTRTKETVTPRLANPRLANPRLQASPWLANLQLQANSRLANPQLANPRLQANPQRLD